MNRFSPGTLIAAAVSAAMIWALYFWFPYTFGYGSSRVSISGMVWALWHEHGDWEHCILVLPIVIWLVWRQREALAKLPVEGSWWGLALVLFSLALFWAGFRADIQYVGFASAQFLVAGLILWLLGWGFMKQLFFAWLFLGFMWPLIFLDTQISFPLRMIMAEISYRFLNLIGLETMRVGSAIQSAPDLAQGLAAGERFQVDIADPCSGIRSLFALTMVAALYGHITLKRWWQVGALILSALPLAVLGNFVRIMLLTFGVLAFGNDFAIGTLESPSAYHSAAGFAVFGVALLGMVGVARLLKWLALRLEQDRPDKPVSTRASKAEEEPSTYNY